MSPVARRLMACALALIAAVAVTQAQGNADQVRVTADKANVRADANATAPVLTQLSAGAIVTLLGVEGEWLRVKLPPDPRLGGAAAIGYVSKKVAKIEPATAPAAPVGPPAPPPPDEHLSNPAFGIDGAAVRADGAAGAAWLTVQLANVQQAADTPAKSIAALVAASALVAPPPAPGLVPVWWVWIVDARAPADIVRLRDRRPSFEVLYRETMPGIRARELRPVIVKAAIAAGDVRIVGAMHGRIDDEMHVGTDWDFGADFLQDVVASVVEPLDHGARVHLSADLAPGEYAIVLRPVEGRKVAQSFVLTHTGAGRVFTDVFAFTIR